jgi:hypothetical protein
MDCVEVPIAGIEDGELVGAPPVGVLATPIVERVVPINGDDVVPSVCDPVVGVDPVVPSSEVSAGSVVAEGPIPSFAAKASKSVVPAKPRVASKASKAGSDAAGMTTAVSVGNVSVLGLETVGAVVPMPPIAVPELSVEDCAWATQGVAMSAIGATHLTVRFIPPPCANRHVHIDHCRACVVPRGVVVRLVYDEVGGAITRCLDQPVALVLPKSGS